MSLTCDEDWAVRPEGNEHWPNAGEEEEDADQVKRRKRQETE